MAPRRSIPEQSVVLAVFVAATCLWTLWAGKDLSWDAVNHHLYLPFSLASGRYASDLFAAGPQSYQNPIGYLPFYGLVAADLPDWVVGCVLATLHALAIVPLWRIACVTWPDGRRHRLWRWLAVGAAWASPAFLVSAGSSSVDPIASALVLAALATVIGGRGTPVPLVLGGLALGLAVAIKPVNGIFALAIGPILLVRLATRQLGWHAGSAFVAASVVAALAFAGPWAWWLWATFGNPVFPLFNDVFRSPFAPAQPVLAIRFLPEAPADWLSRPLDMAALRRFASAELFTPDLRPAAAALAAVAFVPFAAARRLRVPLTSPTLQLSVFALVAYLLWMQSSGNARYALPLMACVGLLGVRGAHAILAERAARIVVAVVLVLHTANFVAHGDRRMTQRQWTGGPYVPVTTPAPLRETPHLHLSVGTLAFASLALQLHPEGALVNVVGQMSLPTDGALGRALAERLARWQGRTRFLLRASRTALTPSEQRSFERFVVHLGLGIDWNDCLEMSIDGDRDGSATPQPAVRLLSCAAVPKPFDDARYLADRKRADAAFHAIETRCPVVFGPSAMITIAGVDTWGRRYANSDVHVTITAEDDVLAGHFRSLSMVNLGKVPDILSGRGLDPCEAWKRLKTP